MQPTSQHLTAMMGFYNEAVNQGFANNAPIFLNTITKEAEYQIFHWLNHHGRQSWGWWNA